MTTGIIVIVLIIGFSLFRRSKFYTFKCIEIPLEREHCGHLIDILNTDVSPMTRVKDVSPSFPKQPIVFFTNRRAIKVSEFCWVDPNNQSNRTGLIQEEAAAVLRNRKVNSLVCLIEGKVRHVTKSGDGKTIEIGSINQIPARFHLVAIGTRRSPGW
jgi:hypothetical protein